MNNEDRLLKKYPECKKTVKKDFPAGLEKAGSDRKQLVQGDSTTATVWSESTADSTIAILGLLKLKQYYQINRQRC